MALFRDVKPGDVLRIGDTVIEVESKTGMRVRLRIDTPLEISHQKAGTMTRPPIPAARAVTAPVANQPGPRLVRPPIAIAG